MWKPLTMAALLALPVAADNASEIRQLMGNSLIARSLRITGDWATCAYTDKQGNPQGTSLLHRMDGRWRKLFSMGGTMSAGDAYQYGLPRRVAAQMGWRGEFLDGPYWPELSTSQVSQEQLRKVGRDWPMTLMRNELYARHGHVFADAELRKYFLQRAWYKPGKETALSTQELANVRSIANYQQTHRLP